MTATTVLVGGALANKAGNGGEAWVRLSWVRGLAQLGFHPVFVEQLDTATAADPAGAIAYFTKVVADFDLAASAALILDGGPWTVGLSWDDLLARADDASAIVNISGHLTSTEVRKRVAKAVYVDIDPGFTQFWLDQGISGDHLDEHDLYFTIGEQIGRSGCAIPTAGLEWQPVRQPVILDDWPVVPSNGTDELRFTTVANWRGPFGPVTHDGRLYGLKVHEFRKMLRLPGLVDHRFELALNIDPADEADRGALWHNGWNLADPRRVSADPQAFRHYVQGSDAEFSVAQGIYVASGCGWFSDRTVRYLASGRPALVQETGFSKTVPSGTGLVSFRALDDAAAAVARIAGNYAEHRLAAREIAETHFAAHRVLPDFCDRIGIAP